MSDTGDEAAFFDVDGNELTAAYSGQGEQDGTDGLDWIR